MKNKSVVFLYLTLLICFIFRIRSTTVSGVQFRRVIPFVQTKLTKSYLPAERKIVLRRNIKSVTLEETKNKRKTEETQNNLLQNKNCVLIEIRAGVGGKEAVTWSHELKKSYKTFAEKNKWEVKEKNDICKSLIIKANENVTFFINDEKINISLFDLFKNESGIHQIKRVPLNESKGRIHSSTSTVAVFLGTDIIEQKDVTLKKVTSQEIISKEMTSQEITSEEITPKEIKIKTFRSSKPGGQNVNKIESGVSVVHIPTGIHVECQQERTQELNKRIALRKLNEKLKQMKLAKREKETQKRRVALIKGGKRSERIRTYNFAKGFIIDYIRDRKLDITYFQKNKWEFLLNIK